MDLLEALRSFESVATHRNFTRAAAALAQPQPVTSRRVAALESHLGVRLFARTSRRVELTGDGERLLPVARALLAQAARLERLFDDERPGMIVAVPSSLDHRARAVIRRGLPHLSVTFLEDEPEERRAALAERRAALAVIAAASDRADLTVPLGLAGQDDPPRFLAGLRPGVHDRHGRPRALHLLAEDDHPVVRDPLRAAAFAAGLRADQFRVATPPADAWTAVFEHGDVVVCSHPEAERQGLAWVELEPTAVRSYRLLGAEDGDPPGIDAEERRRLLARLAAGLGGGR